MNERIADADVRNVVIVDKGRERYVLLYTDDHAHDALQMLGRWAEHPELSFTWYDASLASKRIRDIREASNECE